MTTGTCGPDGCGECTLACAGGRPSPVGADLAVVAAGGVVAALLAGILALGAVRWVAVLGGVTAVAGVALAATALLARAGGEGASAGRVALRLLPYVTGGFLLTVLARGATTLIA